MKSRKKNEKTSEFTATINYKSEVDCQLPGVFFFPGKVTPYPAEVWAELLIHPLSCWHWDQVFWLNQTAARPSVRSVTLNVCVSLCPAFYGETWPTPRYPSSWRNTIFTRDLSQVHIWLCNSFKDQLLAHAQMQRNPKCAYILKFIQSLTHSHTYRCNHSKHSYT